MATSPAALDHQRVAFLLAFTLLTLNSGLAVYLSWGDAVSVSSVGVCYLDLLLLFASRCRKSPHDGEGARTGGRWLNSAISVLSAVLALLLAYKLLSAAPPSGSVLLVAVAGATALGVGGCCAFLLHRLSWSKQPRQEVTLPLVQDAEQRPGCKPCLFFETT